MSARVCRNEHRGAPYTAGERRRSGKVARPSYRFQSFQSLDTSHRQRCGTSRRDGSRRQHGEAVCQRSENAAWHERLVLHVTRRYMARAERNFADNTSGRGLPRALRKKRLAVAASCPRFDLYKMSRLCSSFLGASDVAGSSCSAWLHTPRSSARCNWVYRNATFGYQFGDVLVG